MLHAIGQHVVGKRAEVVHANEDAGMAGLNTLIPKLCKNSMAVMVDDLSRHDDHVVGFGV